MEPRQSVGQLFRDGAKKLLNFLVPFLVDTARGSLVFLALLFIKWLIGLGKAFGVRQEELDAFDQAHFWISYGVFIAVGVSYLLRVVKGIFRGD